MKNRNIFNFLLLLAFIFSAACKADNPGLQVGETIPNPEILPIYKYQTDQQMPVSRLHDYKEDKVLLIAFMPSVTQNYSDVMNTAFETYFAEGLSFRTFEKYSYENPDMQIIVVTPDDKEAIEQYMTGKDLNFTMVSDKSMHISNLFGISKWEWDKTNNGSQVYIVDKNNKIVYADYDYKGQGEKLKSVQSELYTMFDLKEEINSSQHYEPLTIGDNARDFNFQYISFNLTEAYVPTSEGRLSDYIGKKNVLIAFYPAAYSYSCSAEITKFDHWAEDRMLEKVQNSQLNNDDLEILMVSVSNQYILSKWKNDINLNNVKLVSDNNGTISQMYSSFNQLGYNKRTIFLIDKEGKVSYINWDYKVDDNDFALLKDNVMALK
jgi:peroxiredoxin